MKEDGHDDTKDTAMSHSPSTPPLSKALGAFTDPFQDTDNSEPALKEDDDDVANMLKGMKKKKSKKPKLKTQKMRVRRRRLLMAMLRLLMEAWTCR